MSSGVLATLCELVYLATLLGATTYICLMLTLVSRRSVTAFIKALWLMHCQVIVRGPVLRLNLVQRHEHVASGLQRPMHEQQCAPVEYHPCPGWHATRG